jgi:hypothetical protein
VKPTVDEALQIAREPYSLDRGMVIYQRAAPVLAAEIERLRRNIEDTAGRFGPEADHDYAVGWCDAVHYMEYGELPDPRD